MKNYSRDVVIGKLARHGITVGQGEIVIKKELSVGINRISISKR